ncbi:MAG: ABC transporter ATP-binding protein [Lachnospiraceae bacterium]|nr:ABC transporter ATP-binding protein [Lachnospiraceae bacterium]
MLKITAEILGAISHFFMVSYLFAYVINALQEGGKISVILITLGWISGLNVLSVTVRQIEGWYTSLKTPQVNAYIQNLLQEKAATVDIGCFESSEFYNHYVKAMDEATKRTWRVLDNQLALLNAVVHVGSTGILIFTIHPIFLVLSFLPLLYTSIFGKKRNRIQYEKEMHSKEVGRQKDYVRRTFYLKEYSKEMRLTGISGVMMGRMQSSVKELKEISRQYGYRIMWLNYLFTLVADIVVFYGTVLLASLKTLVTREILLGDCFAVINAVEGIAYGLSEVGMVMLRIEECSLYIENLRGFLEYKVQIAEEEDAPVALSVESLELQHVGFRYEGQEKQVLQDVNLRIHRGDKIAIVGHNGAGKSTLIKLLLRLYDVTEGAILYNGRDIRTYRLSTYRNLYGTVFQDYQLFATTVAENVLLRASDGQKDRECVELALKNSGMAERIGSLAEGVDSNVTREFDKQGAVFSGGEAQKLSIARVFAVANEIVILDEPTSALDPIAEQEMYQHMFEACIGKTVIFISHRLSSAAMADRIYVFEKGRIVEEGTHRELLNKDGIYADMWHKQADIYTEYEEGGEVEV